MSVRRVDLELEAKLEPRAGGFSSKSSGKVERKRYSDGTERLKVRVKRVRAPDGTEGVVTADGEEIARLRLLAGAGRLDEETRDPDALPTLEVGQTIDLTVLGETVLSGKLVVD